MHRFFVEKDKIAEDKITITGEEKKHLTKVLRLKVGDSVIVSDNKASDYISLIESIGEESVILSILEIKENLCEPKIHVSLFQGIPKGDKMDGVIKRSVELGVYEIYPVMTKRTVVKLNEKNSKKKIERWQRIAFEASKQCQRGCVPKVHMPITFKQALKKLKDLDIALFPYELAKDGNVNNVLKDEAKTIGFIVGPEGGFSDSEAKMAIEEGCFQITLGKRILRTETVSLALLSLIMNKYGELS